MNLKSRGAFIYNLHKAQSIESYRDLKRHVLAIEIAIEELSRGFLSNEVRWIEVAIEETESFSMDRTSYRELLRMR